MNDIRKFLDLWNKMMYILNSRQKKLGIIVFILSTIGALLELLGVSIILPFATVMVNPDSLRENIYVSSLCEFLGIETNTELIVLVTTALILVYIIKNLYLAFLAWVRIKYATKVERELSIKMMTSYINRGYGYLRTINAAVISRGCGTSVSAIQQIISCFFRILTDCLTLALIVVFIAITDFYMAITMLFVAIIALFLIIVVFRRSVKKAGQEAFLRSSETGKAMNQLIYGIKEILVMNKPKFFLNNYEQSYYKQQKAQITNNLSQTYPSYLIEAICVTGLMITLCFKIVNMDNPADYVAQLAAFAVAAFRLLPSIGRISSTFSYFLFQIPFANEVYDNLHEAESYIQNQRLVDNNTYANKHFNNELIINDVSFMYPDGQEYVLDHIYLNIKRGDSIAFVGPSGAGKSTLADIILGLYTPQTGSVTMDGIDILSHPEMWSSNVGYVPQSVYLLDDTVRNNIAFGHSPEDIDDTLIWSVLEQAQMKPFISSLPNGINTMIGERGVRFSGGQAQRLAIARALYNNPSILVLDEATSALDNDTEHAIMDAINALQGQKTLIIIAHRLTTVKNCDHIYEIRDGKITEKQYTDL